MLTNDAQQFSETAMKYGGEKAHKVFTEEGLTELPYDRWVQVRTPAFKAEFGDWSFAKDNRMMRKAETKLDIRHILNELRNIEFTNHDSGITATLSRKSIEKIISSKAFEKSLLTTDTGFVHLAAAANIDRLFTEGTLGWIKSDALNDLNISGLPRIFTPMLFEEKLYMAQTTVKILDAYHETNRLYTVEAINILDSQQIMDKFSEDIKKEGNASPVTMADPNLGINARLVSCRPLGVSRVLTIAEQVIDFNSKPIKSNMNPETGEPTIDFLKSHIPSPLIDLSGLGNREAARKLHDMTGGDIAHLPLITASAHASGKRINIDALKTVQNQHPTIKQETWLKAVADAPQHTKSRQKDNTR